MPNAPKALPTERDIAIVAVLDRRREALRLTQEQVAALSHLSQPQVSRVLKGVRPVTLTELRAPCEALDIALSDVLREAGE